MLHPPQDEGILNALVSLESDESWQRVLEWLASGLEQERDELCREPDEGELRKRQGVAQTLKCITGSAANARDALRRLRTKEARKAQRPTVGLRR